MKLLFSYLFFCIITLISCSSNDNPQNTDLNLDFIKLQINPNQCEAPWSLSSGNTPEEKIKNYLTNLEIGLENYQETHIKNITTCAACGCPGLFIYTITVKKKHQTELEREGFVLVTE